MAFIPDQQFVIAITGTASTALDIFEGSSNLPSELQLMLYSDVDVVVLTGKSTVVADEAVTSSKMVQGNYVLPAGAILLNGLNDIQKYVSAISLDGATTGTLYITRGLGEKV